MTFSNCDVVKLICWEKVRLLLFFSLKNITLVRGSAFYLFLRLWNIFDHDFRSWFCFIVIIHYFCFLLEEIFLLISLWKGVEKLSASLSRVWLKARCIYFKCPMMLHWNISRIIEQLCAFEQHVVLYIFFIIIWGLYVFIATLLLS